MVDEKAFTAARAAYPLGMNVPHADCLRAAITAYLQALSPGSTGEAEVDAARYRWLKTQARIEHRDGATNGTWRVTGIPAYRQFEKAAFDHKTFDGAVDHAMLSAGCRRAVVSEDRRGVEAPSVTSAEGER